MLTEIPRWGVSVVVVHKLDRFMRNVYDHVGIRAQLLRAGAVLRSASERLGESPAEQLTEHLLAAVNQWSSANLGQEVKKGMTQKVRNGGWPTTAPTGYRNIRTHGNGSRRGESSLVPDAEMAPLVADA